MRPGSDGHRYFEELAVAHVVGGLDESEGRAFRAHLLECGDCRAQVGELRAIAHDLADVERDERRVRAAKAIETKRREADQDDLDDDEPPGSSRASRIAVVAGLVLVILLSAWNFTLRGRVVELAQDNRRGAEASDILGFGEPWDVVRQESVQGTVRQLGDSIVLLVVNAKPDRTYGVYLQSGVSGFTLHSPVKPNNGRFLVSFEGAMGVLVTDPGPNVLPGEILTGRTVFEAKPPTPST